MKSLKNTVIKSSTSLCKISLTSLILIFIAIVAIFIAPSQVTARAAADNTPFIAELTARQNVAIDFAKTWVVEEMAFDLQEISFSARINANALSRTSAEIWRVEATNQNGVAVAILDVDRITGNISVMRTAFPELEIYINGAKITITDITALHGDTFINIFTPIEHIPASEVVAIIATEIMQEFDVNLDGAKFVMAFADTFWSANVLLDYDETPIGELPYVVPDFFAIFDNARGTVTSLTDF